MNVSLLPLLLLRIILFFIYKISFGGWQRFNLRPFPMQGFICLHIFPTKTKPLIKIYQWYNWFSCSCSWCCSSSSSSSWSWSYCSNRWWCASISFESTTIPTIVFATKITITIIIYFIRFTSCSSCCWCSWCSCSWCCSSSYCSNRRWCASISFESSTFPIFLFLPQFIFLENKIFIFFISYASCADYYFLFYYIY